MTTGPWSSIAQIKKANKAIGGKWWLPETMEYWNTRIMSDILAGRYLIVSHQYIDHNHPGNNGPILYTLWFIDEYGHMAADYDYCNRGTLQEVEQGAALRLGEIPQEDGRELARHLVCGEVLWMVNRMPTDMCLYYASDASTQALTTCPFCGQDLDYEDVMEQNVLDTYDGGTV